MTFLSIWMSILTLTFIFVCFSMRLSVNTVEVLKVIKLACSTCERASFEFFTRDMYFNR